MHPTVWVLVMLEPYAGKLACTVLREERGCEAPDLPGCVSGGLPYVVGITCFNVKLAVVELSCGIYLSEAPVSYKC